jgi:phage baseplate assembly protein W
MTAIVPASPRPAFFQPALSIRAGSHSSGLAGERQGEIVTGVADVNQCLYVILTTPRGADPHRPTFGSGLYRYLDHPIDSARPHLVREAVDAIRAWEPRVRVLRVHISLSDLAALQCEVEWTFAEGIDPEAFTTGVFTLRASA